MPDEAEPHPVDRFTRGLLAGLGLGELRRLLRGEPSQEKPNPRYRAHGLSFLLHMRPRWYPAASTWFSNTFRLGFLSVFLLAVEGITGLLLMFYYQPTPEGAYASIIRLHVLVPFGELLRDVHRLAAEAMVVCVLLHLLRTFLTASYKKDRRFTWWTGAVLLLLTLAFTFTGYLLPWDQLAYWAVTVGTSIAGAVPGIGSQLLILLRGGADIGADGLLRFYQLHVFLLPLLSALFLAIHYYRVARIHSISVPPRIEEGDLTPMQREAALRRVDLVPDLLIREGLWIALGTVALIAAALFLYDAPLEGPANPALTPFRIEAPWFFLWVQGLLKLGDITVWGILVPAVLVLVLLFLPWLDRNPWRSPRRRVVELSALVIFLATLAGLTWMGTSGYGVHLQPATDLAQRFSPDEGEGWLQETPWDALEPGFYPLEPEGIATIPPGLRPLASQITGTAGEIFPENPQLTLVIELRQADLKRVTLRMQWQDEEGAQRHTDHSVWLHRERAIR